MAGPTNILSSLGTGLTNMFEGLDIGDILKGDNLWDGLSTGADLWGAYNTGKAMDKQFNLADRNMAMTEDAYRRDKEAEERRQNLNFA